MATYKIKAIKSDGTKYTETLEEENKLDLKDKIKERGDTLISAQIEASNSSGGLSEQLKKFSIGGSVKSQEIVTATQNLSSMLKAGLSLSRSLSVLIKQSRNPHFQNVLKDIRGRIESGENFGSALEKHPKVFSDLYVAMVRSGEEGGTLSDVLQTLGRQMEKTQKLKKKIKGAMMYPSVILCVMVIIAILMVMFIVPTLSEAFAGLDAELPTVTQMVIEFSDFLVENTLLTLGSGFLVIASIVLFFRRTTIGRQLFDLIILYIPVIKNIVKESNSAHTTRTLSSLLASGVDAVTALDITKNVVQNSYYKPVIEQAKKQIQKGEAISQVFIDNENLYPVLVGEMMAVGEETGQIDGMLNQIADFYEAEVDQKTQDLSTIIEPVLMVIIGVAVGFFAVSMLTPMYTILDQI